ncbi:MAG: phosphatidate cytidylyltransferase [Pelolinea sp.]|nr:phosphatidate cytidylyltransferase [Pelolinea sp.]
MLAKRAASAATIIVFSFLLVLAGGWIYTIGVALILSTAAWEYAAMFRKGGYFPADYVIITGTFFTALASRFENLEYILIAISISILAVIAWHILTYSNHQQTAGIDLAASLSTIVFIAFLGSYIIRLRFLPDGFYWLLMAIAPAGISDIGAYLIGSAIGNYKMAPALSPGKTIEGYLGGVLTAAVTGYVVGAIANIAVPHISGLTGLIIGLVVGVFCPLGDLGKSLLKRQFNLKNTSDLIPGHGGVLDRVDTWLWAGVISYYLIRAFFM